MRDPGLCALAVPAVPVEVKMDSVYLRVWALRLQSAYDRLITCSECEYPKVKSEADALQRQFEWSVDWNPYEETARWRKEAWARDYRP